MGATRSAETLHDPVQQLLGSIDVEEMARALEGVHAAARGRGPPDVCVGDVGGFAPADDVDGEAPAALDGGPQAVGAHLRAERGQRRAVDAPAIAVAAVDEA